MADIELRSIQKSYGPVQVIRDVDLHVADGEFCVFVGPSGCGKSAVNVPTLHNLRSVAWRWYFKTMPYFRTSQCAKIFPLA
jgi:ABC-type polar amino acid transport system ATPase subunit